VSRYRYQKGKTNLDLLEQEIVSDSGISRPCWDAAQPCARVQGYVNDDLRDDGLQKGWGFRVSTWNVDSVTSRADCQMEKLTWHAFKKHDGKVVVPSSMKLKAKHISCSGWEVRRDRMV